MSLINTIYLVVTVLSVWEIVMAFPVADHGGNNHGINKGHSSGTKGSIVNPGGILGGQTGVFIGNNGFRGSPGSSIKGGITNHGVNSGGFGGGSGLHGSIGGGIKGGITNHGAGRIKGGITNHGGAGIHRGSGFGGGVQGHKGVAHVVQGGKIKGSHNSHKGHGHKG